MSVAKVTGASVVLSGPHAMAVAGMLRRDLKTHRAAMPANQVRMVEAIVDALLEAGSDIGTRSAAQAELPSESERMDPATTVLTTSQAADRLDCDPTYVRRLCRNGRFPGATRAANGGWLIPKDEVAALATMTEVA